MGNTSAPPKQFLSDKVGFFTESVIRDMTRQAALYGAVNLAQGFPDFPAPAEIKLAAQEAIAEDINQYAITWDRKISAMQSHGTCRTGSKFQLIPRRRSQYVAARPRQ